MTDIDKQVVELMQLATEYAHCYAFVEDDRMPCKQTELEAAIRAALQSVQPDKGTQIAELLSEQEYKYSRETNALIKRHSEQITQLLAERDEARSKLAEAQAREVHLLGVFSDISAYWNRDRNDAAMHDACWYAVNKAEAALAIPTDASALSAAIAAAVEPYKAEAERSARRRVSQQNVTTENSMLQTLKLLQQAFDALDTDDSEIDCFESEEEEAKYAPKQYACRKIMEAMDNLLRAEHRN